MTDLIIENKQGESVHFFIADNNPAIIHIREGGKLRVKISGHFESQLKKVLETLCQREGGASPT